MENKLSIEELYPHLFMNDAKLMMNAVLRVDDEAARIKAKVSGRNTYQTENLTIEEKQEIAFKCIEANRVNEREKLKLAQARSMQKKHLREYDPRIGIEERHLKVAEKKQIRIAKSNAEENLEQLRAQRQKLTEEISPLELEKIKNEIKQTAQETRAQDMLKRKQLKEIQEREKVSKEKEELLAEKERKIKEFAEHKVMRFSTIIANFIRNYKKDALRQTFQRVNMYAFYLKSTSLKIQRKFRFKRLKKSFFIWKRVAVIMKIEEEAIIFQAEEERILYLYEIAKKNYEFWLKRKSFESLEKNLQNLALEREQQAEALRRREKFSNFMSFIKQRTEEEQSKKQVEDILAKRAMEKDRYFAERSRVEERLIFIEKVSNFNKEARIESSESIEVTEKIEKISEAPCREYGSIKESYEEEKVIKETESKNESETVSISETSTNNQNRAKTPKQSKEFTRMQQRQEERKLKREALEAKYKEKREKEEKEKQELILKSQLEEKQKKKDLINKKKQEEKNKKEREEKKLKYLEELEKHTEIAINHYNSKVCSKGLNRWKSVYIQAIENKILAENLYNQNIKKNLWSCLMECVKVIKSEKQEIESKRMNWAYNQYLMRIERKYFKKLKNIANETAKRENMMAIHRHNYLKKTVINAWQELIPELMDDRYEKDKADDYIVKRFRTWFFGPKILKDWKKYAQAIKEEKLKDLYTQAMWEKAQLWLSESKNEFT